MTGSTPRDTDINEWLDGIGFKPANTREKQLGHEAARRLIGQLGKLLHPLLPPGRDKALVYTALEDALMRANRALAIGGGPHKLDAAELEEAIAVWGLVELPEDPRIDEYKAQQRDEQPDAEAWLDQLDPAARATVEVRPVDETESDAEVVFHETWEPNPEEPSIVHSLSLDHVQPGGGLVEIKAKAYDEGENKSDVAVVELRSPEFVEGLASALLRARNVAWPR